MKKTAHAFNEENIKYLRGILGDEKVDTFILVLDPKSDRVISSEDDQKSFDTVKKCLEQMEKFGDNSSSVFALLSFFHRFSLSLFSGLIFS